MTIAVSSFCQTKKSPYILLSCIKFCLFEGNVLGALCFQAGISSIYFIVRFTFKIMTGNENLKVRAMNKPLRVFAWISYSRLSPIGTGLLFVNASVTSAQLHFSHTSFIHSSAIIPFFHILYAIRWKACLINTAGTSVCSGHFNVHSWMIWVAQFSHFQTSHV